MKINRKLAADIRDAAQDAGYGDVRCEVGFRIWDTPTAADPKAFSIGANMLLWRGESDLHDTLPLHKCGKEEIETLNGWVSLDLYCYSYGQDGELEGNAYVLINPDGEVVYCTSDDLNSSADIAAILAKHGITLAVDEKSGFLCTA
jgi:hypothetical protein